MFYVKKLHQIIHRSCTKQFDIWWKYFIDWKYTYAIYSSLIHRNKNHARLNIENTVSSRRMLYYDVIKFIQ